MNDSETYKTTPTKHKFSFAWAIAGLLTIVSVLAIMTIGVFEAPLAVLAIFNARRRSTYSSKVAAILFALGFLIWLVVIVSQMNNG